eukprot:TRINITY_DN38380_c0_g1_i1.p1 TRINITY_DN38380_c0_g1~~TRINITY_DN38380_c0_g1_i1.p1  ORF type:complete len:366 (+),score=101.49 TRINITY_DN38380_c0_g1_i1:106-1203(+)
MAGFQWPLHRPQQRHRRRSFLPLAVASGALLATWTSLGGRCWLQPGAPNADVDKARDTELEAGRRSIVGAVAAGPLLASQAAWDAVAEEVPAPAAAAAQLSYDGVVKFNGKPKVAVFGATGELGRRVVIDLLQQGYSVRAAIRDEGKAAEVQFQQIERATTPKYQFAMARNLVLAGGKQAEIEEAIGDASVVIDCAGATKTFDIFRPTMAFDGEAPERTDLNGTKALIDASIARGVKKFVYVSAILTNARALGEEENNEFKKWNEFGNVLDMKHSSEVYLQSKGLDYTIIRPAPMTNDLPEQVGGLQFMKPDSILLKSGEPGNRVSRDSVSQAIVDSIFNAKASKGVFELVGKNGAFTQPKDAWW